MARGRQRLGIVVGTAVAAGIVLLASASAGVGAGGLAQLASPNDCISEADASLGCGTTSGTGLKGTDWVAASPDGNNVYVSSFSSPGAVAAFTRAADGSLSELACVGAFGTECPTTAAGLNEATSVAVSPDGQNVYVTGDQDDTVMIFDRSATDGSLTYTGCVQDTPERFDAGCTTQVHGMGNAYQVVVSPDGKNVYVAAGSGGAGDGAVVELARAADGSLSQLASPNDCIEEQSSSTPVCGTTGTGLLAVTALALDPSGGTSLYAVADTHAVQAGDAPGALTVFTRDTTTGALTQTGCIGESTSVTGITECQSTRAAGLSDLVNIAVSPDGSSVYTASDDPTGPIAEFSRASDGSLTALGCIDSGGTICGTTADGLASAFGVAVSPDGANVYVASAGASSYGGATPVAPGLVELARASDGTLSASGCIQQEGAANQTCQVTTGHGLGDALGVTVSPDGDNVYVATSSSGGAVAAFSRGGGSPPPPSNQAPTAAFTTSTSGLTVAFDGSGSSDADGSVASYAWNFGDGASGTGAAASHTYSASGTYSVTLTVTDNQGTTASATHDVTVTAPPPTNQPPTAAFTASASGLSVSFDATGSSDADGTVASYAWDFGDGGTGTGATPSHSYASAGTYTVTLTVTDNQGATASATHDVTVTAPPPTNQPPTAAFTASVTGLSVSFDATGSSDADGTVASYAWDFGDGSTGSVAAPSHTYSAGGTYTVTLTVTDDGGASATEADSVTVSGAPDSDEPPTPYFTSDGTGLSMSFDASLSDDADGTVASYAWDFGDGASGTGAAASHTYSASGTYSVTLSVTDDQGAAAAITHDVTVAAEGAATIGVVSSIGQTLGLAATATDPNAAVQAYYWDFDDGYGWFWAGATVSHAFSAPGTYTLKLGLANDTGVDEIATKTVVVPYLVAVAGDRSPTADFVSATNGISASFSAAPSSDSDGSIASYEWDFGDGSTATGIDVGHVFSAGGTYNVGLTVTDDKGATATVLHSVRVQAAQPITTLRFASSASGLSALFDASESTDEPNGELDAYTWDFGDGSTGTGEFTAHGYPRPGTYAVTLTVDSGEGSFQGSVVRSITVPKATPRTGGLIWSPVELPSRPQNVTGIACVSDGHCAATGGGLTQFGDGAETTWATTSAAGGAAWTDLPGGGDVPQLVECPTTSACIGYSDKGVFFANPWTDQRWTFITGDGANPFLYGEGKALSCASPSLCIVVGGAGLGSARCSGCAGGVYAGGDVAISTDPTSLNWTTSWFNPDENTVMTSVSCPSTTLCVVVDNGQIFTSPWPRGASVPTLPTWFPSGVQGVAKVTCPTTTFCAGLDIGSGLLTSTNPTGGASAWKSTSIGFTDVACASASFCIGGDTHGTVYTSTLPAGGGSFWSAGPDLGDGSVGPATCNTRVVPNAGSQIYCAVVIQAPRDSRAAHVWVGRQPTVTVGASGPGGVSSGTPGIDCGQTCAHSYFLGEQVTLTAAPSSGSSFRGWTGDCAGTSRTCTLTVQRDMTVGANFAPIPSTTTVTTPVSGGSGATPVTLTAAAAFTAAASSTPGSLTASFDGSSSTGPIGSYRWDFGDGTSGSGKSTGHTFPHAGTYTVTLTVTSAASTDSTSHTITVPADATSTTTPAGTPGTLATGDTASAPVVRWSSRTFSQPVTVTLISQPSTFLQGREHGAPAIQLIVATTAGVPVTRFAAPIELTFSPDASGTVPAYSINGTRWTSMPELSGTTLPAGFKDGWYRDRRGVIHVLTLHATYFGLLRSAADAKAELALRVSATKPRRTMRVRVAATLPGHATVVLRAGKQVVARATGLVRPGARHDFVLRLPARFSTARGSLTVTVVSGRSRVVKHQAVRLKPLSG